MKLNNLNKIYGLDYSNLEKIITIFSSNDKITELILFGSRAMGNFESGSDIDLAVKGNNITFNDLLDLKYEIENLNLPYKIDLADYNNISNQNLKNHINRVGKILFKSH